MASLRESIGQIRTLWSEMATGKKISFILIFAVMAIAFGGLVLWAGLPEYKLLYQDVTIEDANSITTHLEENRVRYQLSRGGTAISVPAEDYYEARMSLANAGLPSGGAVGYELFDRKGLGLTEAQMKVAHLRALQGELARTIKQLDPVEHARVHLAMPKETLFVEDKKEATASIVLKLAANAKLDGEQVDGIVFLVSSSVEGLDPGNVTVIDHKGHVLSSTRDKALGSAGNLEDKAHKLERSLESRVETLLARSVGPEKVAARVNVMLDRQQVQRVEEKYDPDSAVVRSQQKVSSGGKSSESQTSGFPGASSNLPQDQYSEGTQQSSENTKTQEIVNYEINRTTATITEPFGALKMLSVAVLIDGTYEEVEKDGKTVKQYVPRTSDEMLTYEEIVKKIVGFTLSRGDQIEIANIQFVSEALGFEEVPTSQLDVIIRILQYVFAVVGALLFLFIVVRPLIRWLTSEPALERQLGLPAEMLEGATVGELEERYPGQLGPATDEGGGEEEYKESLAERMGRLQQQKADLLETAARDREAVTLMVRRWLKEGDNHV
ncbi:MAG: flagellar basal-body MS-ring/collar protein FliF [Candidatus Lernaella stagnicola]|nr:flagellar basal-body MS-ring/collar protein FliF [Candidatus Lernaella stagnicola]